VARVGSNSDQTVFDSTGFHVMRPQCANCLFRNAAEPMKCASFPNGIPVIILTNRFDHRKRHPDDLGLTYLPADENVTHPMDDPSKTD
jgi:hypothetical protein